MLCLVKTRACKRCGGDLSLEHDRYGTYVECIQCGAIWHELDIVKPDSRIMPERQLAGISEAFENKQRVVHGSF